MRIGVDARELAGRPTGVGRYLAELLACWSRDPVAAEHTITLFTPAPFSPARTAPAPPAPGSAAPTAFERGGQAAAVPDDGEGSRLPPGLIGTGGATVTVRVVPGSGSTVWEQTRLASATRGHVDVLFCPAYAGPLLTPVPMVVTLHDVSFWAHPEWFAPREGWRRRVTTWASAYRAARVLTVSQFSREEIVRLLGISANKIQVIPPGVGGFFDPLRPPPTAGAAAPPDSTNPATHPSERLNGEAPTPTPASQPPGREPLILYVGSIFNRRHLPLLLRAFAGLARDLAAARLVIVGDNRTFPPQDLESLARDLGVAAQVRIAAYVPDEELADLYRRARAFAFLSEYEGFGLTPLEALAAGVPAVMLETPVAREVFRDAALFVPPGDDLAVTAALRTLLDYESARTHCLTRGAALVGEYTWARTATATLLALTEVAEGRAR